MNPAATDPGMATSELGARIRPFIVPQQWRIGLTGRHLGSSNQEEFQSRYRIFHLGCWRLVLIVRKGTGS